MDLLNQLIQIPSISGNEKQLSDYLVNYIHSYISPDIKIEQDKFNNLLIILPGNNNSNNNKTILFDAHSDQIGFIVSEITDKGMLRCYKIGGVTLGAIEAREFIVLTKNGNVTCVTNKKHRHIIKNEKDELPEKIYDIEFDIGCKTKIEAEKIVEIGDYVSYKPLFGRLQNNLIYGTGLDDKIGCEILIRLLKKLYFNNIQHQATIMLSLSCQEETGITRLKTILNKYKIDKIIELDVTFASDYLENSFERQVGKCQLGEGLVLVVGNGFDMEVKNNLIDISKQCNIKLQRQVSSGNGGVNSDAIYELGQTTDVTILGIPLRNMHTPCEVCSIDDIQSGTELLTHYIQNYV